MPGGHHQHIPCLIYIMFGKCVDFTRGSHTLQNITITHIWPLMTYPRRMYKGKKKKNMSVVIKKKNDISLQLQWKINMSVPIQRTRYFITLYVTFMYVMFRRCLDLILCSHTLQNIMNTDTWPIIMYLRRTYKGKIICRCQFQKYSIPGVMYIMFGRCVDFTWSSHSLQKITNTDTWPIMTYLGKTYNEINTSVSIQKTRHFVTLLMTFSFISSCAHLWYYNPYLLSSNEIIILITYIIIQPTYYKHMKNQHMMHDIPLQFNIINMWIIIFRYILRVMFIYFRHVHISLHFSCHFRSFSSHTHFTVLFVSFSFILVTYTFHYTFRFVFVHFRHVHI